ncbi:WD40-repeat-containing domain protein [Pisolithus marmoratus]|nr:WD40-repeat-containing domain protein [Pisolithus marmoratus]
MDLRALFREYCAWAYEPGYSIDLSGRIRRTPGRSPLGGSTAIVYHGTFIPSGPEVAIKTFHSRLSGSEAEVKRIFREVHTWSKLSHENIVSMFGISLDFDSTISIISEWMPLGNAHTYVQNLENDPRPLVRDIADGLYYLHVHELGPIIHGDLKGLNVLVSRERRALLSDFGFSILNISSFNMTTNAIRGGSFPWMAPELLDNGSGSVAADVWAFGMTVLELFTRSPPFYDCTSVANVVYRLTCGRLPVRPDAQLTQFRLTSAWWDICTSCWRTDPSSRPTMVVVAERVRRAMYGTGPRVSTHVNPIISPPFSTGEGPQLTPIAEDACLLPCATLRQPADKILSISFSPDGRRIVSGSANRVVSQWDVHTRAQIGPPLIGHLDWVRSVAFSPSGEWVASGSYDKTICLWDVHRGVQTGLSLHGHTGRVFSVAFSPDGRGVASGSADKTICLWDVQAQTRLRTLVGHTDKVQSVAVSRDCMIASGSHDKTLRVWDGRTGVQVRHPFEGHTGMVWSVAFSPDGRKVVSSSQDGSLRLWDLRNSSQVNRHLEGHTDEVTSVAFSPCGTQLVSGSMDANVLLWDARNGGRVGAPLKGNAGWADCIGN